MSRTAVLAILLVFAFGPVITHAQPPDTLWVRQYPYPGDALPRALEELPDGDFLLASHFYHPGTYDSTGILCTRISATGIERWTRTYPTDGRVNLWDAELTPDGGCLLVGDSLDSYVLKIDSNGTPQWSRSQGPGRWFRVRALPEGQFIAAGSVLPLAGGERATLARLTAEGDTLWRREILGRLIGVQGIVARARDVQVCPAGGFVVGGEAWSISPPFRGMFLARVSEVGDTLWTRVFHSDAQEDAKSVLALPDGDFLLAGGIVSGPFRDDLLVRRIDAAGNLVWLQQFTFFGECDELPLDILPAGPDVLLAGYLFRRWPVVETRGYLLKLSVQGDSLWSQEYRLPWDAGFERTIQTRDGGFAAISNISSDLVLVRLSADQTPVPPRPPVLPAALTLTCFPNPFNSTTTLRFSLPRAAPVSLRMYDVLGREVMARKLGRLAAGDHSERIKAEGLASGIYFVRVQAGARVVVRKVALVR